MTTEFAFSPKVGVRETPFAALAESVVMVAVLAGWVVLDLAMLAGAVSGV